MQMRFADVMKRSEHGALQEAEISLDRVCMPEESASIFVGRMIDGPVQGEAFADFGIELAFVCHEAAGLVNVFVDHGAKRLR